MPGAPSGVRQRARQPARWPSRLQPTGEVTEITVDLRTLTSDKNRRDQRIREQWLESNTYPYATFVSTELQGGPESYTEGEEVSFKLVGDMTIREQTRPVTWDVTAKLEGDTVTGTATTSNARCVI